MCAPLSFNTKVEVTFHLCFSSVWLIAMKKASWVFIIVWDWRFYQSSRTRRDQNSKKNRP